MNCPACNGNDRDAPCAYPSEGRAGCLRDQRLADELPLEQKVGAILQAAISGNEPRYRYENNYIRWGLVEREIKQAIRAAFAEKDAALRACIGPYTTVDGHYLPLSSGMRQHEWEQAIAALGSKA